MSGRDESFEKSLALIQTPSEAKRLSTLVIDLLSAVDGYGAIPPRVQTAIEQVCVQLYGAGVVRGIRHQKEIEK